MLRRCQYPLVVLADGRAAVIGGGTRGREAPADGMCGCGAGRRPRGGGGQRAAGPAALNAGIRTSKRFRKCQVFVDRPPLS